MIQQFHARRKQTAIAKKQTKVDLTEILLLFFSKNMIMQVKPKTFQKQRYLEELHLAQNNISKLTADMFIGLVNLTVSNVMHVCVIMDISITFMFISILTVCRS